VQHGRVKLSCENGIAHVELHRPDKRNAVDMAMFEDIAQTIAHIESLEDIDCVILSGAGDVFCAGIDLSLLQSPEALLPLLDKSNYGGANIFQNAAWGWRTLSMPVIAAVQGVAFGAGCQMMLGADIRIASAQTRMAFMETSRGLVPDMAAFPLLRGNVRDDVARELIFTSRIILGAEAAQIGLITHISDDPLAQAQLLAQAIVSQNRQAVRAAKRLFNASHERSAVELLQAEAKEQKKILLAQ